MLNNQTQLQLNELSLKGALRALEFQYQQPDIHRLSLEERLGMLLDAEVSDRETRRIERLKKAAKLRHTRACIEDIDFHPSRQLDQSLLMSLADCTWIERHQNLILTGATGTGKSWVGCLFGDLACRHNFSTYYTTATQLFEDLSRAQLDSTLPKLRRMLVKTHLLILDDFGIGGIDSNLAPILLDIIDQQSQSALY